MTSRMATFMRDEDPGWAVDSNLQRFEMLLEWVRYDRSNNESLVVDTVRKRLWKGNRIRVEIAGTNQLQDKARFGDRVTNVTLAKWCVPRC